MPAGIEPPIRVGRMSTGYDAVALPLSYGGIAAPCGAVAGVHLINCRMPRAAVTEMSPRREVPSGRL